MYGSDCAQLAMAVAILALEWLVRFTLYFFPYSFADYVRYHLFSRIPRIFRGWRDREIPELGHFKTTAKEMVENGAGGMYSLEEYAVFVPDGYVVILHRLCFADEHRHGRSGLRLGMRSERRMPPVLLNHGAMMTSEAWLAGCCLADGNDDRGAVCVPKTLPHMLLHAGYDVWMTNRRGNKYSCKHIRWPMCSWQFWSFSLDEPMCRDLPAVVDFVLEETQFRKLGLIGFSQGAAEILGALSIVKALNGKVSMGILLAPTTRPRPSSFRSSLVRSVVKLTPGLVFLIFGRRMMLPFVPFWKRCFSPRAYAFMLDKAMAWLFGWHCRNILAEEKSLFYHYLFSYTSVRQIVHWFQVIRAGRFQMFDEGSSMSLAPGHLAPAYPLHQISAPLALFEGTADTLRDPSLKALPAVVTRITVANYEHLDFMWAESVDRKVWPHVLKLLGKTRSVSAVPGIDIDSDTGLPSPSSDDDLLH